jgi:hypothetical protein
VTLRERDFHEAARKKQARKARRRRERRRKYKLGVSLAGVGPHIVKSEQTEADKTKTQTELWIQPDESRVSTKEEGASKSEEWAGGECPPTEEAQIHSWKQAPVRTKAQIRRERFSPRPLTPQREISRLPPREKQLIIDQIRQRKSGQKRDKKHPEQRNSVSWVSLVPTPAPISNHCRDLLLGLVPLRIHIRHLNRSGANS